MISVSSNEPDTPKISREAIRFLSDLASRPLSTTVSRYQRLNLSRRRGNAIRQQLASSGIIEAVPIATRSGQVVLYQLTDHGRSVCARMGIEPGARPRASLEHQYWVQRATDHFEKRHYKVTYEHVIKGNGAVDVLAERPGERIAIEVETGQSDIKANLNKVRNAGFDRVVLIAKSPEEVTVCHKVMDDLDRKDSPPVELLTWLDVS